MKKSAFFRFSENMVMLFEYLLSLDEIESTLDKLVILRANPIAQENMDQMVECLRHLAAARACLKRFERLTTEMHQRRDSAELN